MPTSMTRLLSQLSRADLERLLETKAEVEGLEARRAGGRPASDARRWRCSPG